jgi:hypothetical protein
MRRSVVVAVCLFGVLISACGGSTTTKTQSTPPSRTDQAAATMTQACVEVGRVVLSKDPTSGVPRMSLPQAMQGVQQASESAQSAAQLDPKWTEGADAVKLMAQAFRLESYAKLDAAYPRVERVCGPLVALAVSTTVP